MIIKHTCTNGVRIVFEKMPHVRSVSMGIWIETGSRYEKPSENGISHFIEHMLFKGTPTRSAQDIAEAFDHIGGEINAFTGREETCYFAKVLDEHAELALDILSDMLFHPLLDPEEFEKEKQVILEEINMYEDTPDDLVHDMLSAAIYKQHALGLPVLGTEASLETLTPDDLRRYMAANYRPERMIVSVAGHVDEVFIKKVEDVFSRLKNGSEPQSFNRPVFHTDHVIKDKETEQGHLCLGFEGLDSQHDDLLPLLVMNNILGGNTSSRLFQEVREKKGLAYSIFSDHTEYRDNGLLTIYGGTGKKQLPQLLDTIMNVIDKLKQEGVKQKELANSLSQLKGSLLLSMESSSYRMNRNAENEIIYRRPKTVEDVLKDFEKVTLGDINHVLKNTFDRKYALSMINPIG